MAPKKFGKYCFPYCKCFLGFKITSMIPLGASSCAREANFKAFWTVENYCVKIWNIPLYPFNWDRRMQLDLLVCKLRKNSWQVCTLCFFFWLVDEWNSVPCPVIRHETLRGKLTHPSQRQELESTGRFADQTKNSTSTKNVKKVLYVTVMYTTDEARKISL